MYRALRYFLRKFYFTLAIVVIAFAVLVQSGRAFSYLASEYKEEFASYLSQKINGKVVLGSLKAEWEDLQPVLEVSSIVLFDQENTEQITIEHIWLRLDLLATLFERELVWGNFTLSGSSIAVDQDDQGQWTLRGAHVFQNETDEASDDNTDGLLDALLVAKKVAFENTKIQLQFKDQQTLLVSSPSLLLENKDDFHRLLLSVDTDSHNNTLFFVAEGVGDPRDEDFESEAYLQFKDFPISKFATAATALLPEATRSELALNDGVVDGAVWFVNESSAGGYGVVGSLGVSGVYLYEQAINATQTELKSLKLSVNTELSGQINNFNQWHMSFQDFQSSIGDVNLDSTHVSVSRAHDAAPLNIKISELDAKEVSTLLLSNSFFPADGTVTEVLNDLSASGRLEKIQITIPTEKYEDWVLSGNLEDVSVKSWGHVPAFTHVSGYLSASRFHGSLDLDSAKNFSMSFQDVYENPLEFDSAKGQVAWHLLPEKNKVYVNSGKLLLSDNLESAQGEFLLSLPWRKNTDDVDLTIALKAENVQVTQQKKYVPIVVHEDIRHWLDESIGDENSGVATELDFIFRGTVSTREFIDKNIQLSLALTDGDLQYHADWPAVNKVNASLLLDNAEVFSIIHSGVLYNTQVTQAVLSITDNPVDEGPLLRLVGSVDGIASDGLRILRESMLQRYIGNAMDRWYLHGQMEGSIDIAVPLQASKKGGYQDVEFILDAPSFSMDNLGLEFDDFTGTLSYHSDTGLSADNLNAYLFGHPIEVNIGGESAIQKQTGIDVSGVVSSQDLAEWTKRPEVLFLDGDIAYDAHIEINHHASQDVADASIDKPNTENTQDKLLAAISVTSSLDGVAVDLPAPFFKDKNATRDFSLNYILGEDSTLLDMHYTDLLTAVMHIDTASGQLLSGSVGLGVKAELPTEPALHIEGEVLTFDVNRWQKILASYEQKQQFLSAQNEKKTEGELGLPITTDIVIAEQHLGPIVFNDLRVRTRQMPDSWDFLLSSENLLGELNVPLDEALPVVVAMEFLTLDEALLESSDDSEKTVSVDENEVSVDGVEFDFSSIRDAKVLVKSFHLGAKDYGRWAFDLGTDGNELLVNNVEGIIRDLTVTGEADQGASLRWNNDTHSTHLTAKILADDLSTALEKWQQPARITSESAQFDLRLQWPGAPQQFNLLTAAGDIDVAVNKGKFIRQSGSTGEGLLRLMGLFNFDTLARRLRLDFSDLSGGGLAFDQITGELLLDRGLLHISEPIVLDGASSRMQLTGDIDITNETLNTQLVATLPLAGNLTVVAALAAGLPAAAGVWIVSKLFEKQVNKMTSVSYSITGSWNDPISQFDRLAENKSSGDDKEADNAETETMDANPEMTTH